MLSIFIKKVSFSLGIVILCNNEDDCRRVLSALALYATNPKWKPPEKSFRLQALNKHYIFLKDVFDRGESYNICKRVRELSMLK